MDRIPQQTPEFSPDSSPPVAADRQIVGVDSLSAKVSCTSDAQAISAMNARGQPHDTDAFICMLTDHQIDLQSFIMSSLGNYSDTLDVLQMTNIALWKKAATFRSGAPFLPWSLKVAKFEILAFMRTRRRDRHTFSPELVELMLDVAVERSPQMSDRSLALRDCIKELSERNREFLRIRYSQNQSIHEVAEKTGRSVDSVKSLYLRIRRALERCIDRKLAAEAR